MKKKPSPVHQAIADDIASKMGVKAPRAFMYHDETPEVADVSNALEKLMSKKSKSKKPSAKRSVKRAHKKAANLTFKGSSGALARKKLGIHLLIVRIPIATVKRIDKGLKGTDRQPWLASVIERASKHARPVKK